MRAKRRTQVACGSSLGKARGATCTIFLPAVSLDRAPGTNKSTKRGEPVKASPTSDLQLIAFFLSSSLSLGIMPGQVTQIFFRMDLLIKGPEGSGDLKPDPLLLLYPCSTSLRSCRVTVTVTVSMASVSFLSLLRIAATAWPKHMITVSLLSLQFALPSLT